MPAFLGKRKKCKDSKIATEMGECLTQYIRESEREREREKRRNSNNNGVLKKQA